MIDENRVELAPGPAEIAANFHNTLPSEDELRRLESARDAAHIALAAAQADYDSAETMLSVASDTEGRRRSKAIRMVAESIEPTATGQTARETVRALFSLTGKSPVEAEAGGELFADEPSLAMLLESNSVALYLIGGERGIKPFIYTRVNKKTEKISLMANHRDGVAFSTWGREEPRILHASPSGVESQLVKSKDDPVVPIFIKDPATIEQTIAPTGRVVPTILVGAEGVKDYLEQNDRFGGSELIDRIIEAHLGLEQAGSVDIADLKRQATDELLEYYGQLDSKYSWQQPFLDCVASNALLYRGREADFVKEVLIPSIIEATLVDRLASWPSTAANVAWKLGVAKKPDGAEMSDETIKIKYSGTSAKGMIDGFYRLAAQTLEAAGFNEPKELIKSIYDEDEVCKIMKQVVANLPESQPLQSRLEIEIESYESLRRLDSRIGSGKARFYDVLQGKLASKAVHELVIKAGEERLGVTAPQFE